MSKAFAQPQLDLLVLRRVRDAVFADELRRALAVLRVDPHDAGRQRLAELAALVFKFQEDRGLQFLPDLSVAIPVVILVAGQQVFAAHRHGAGREQRELLGLVVGDRGRPLEAVEVVVQQRFLRRLGRLGARRGRGHRHHAHVGLAHAIHRAGHQLQRGVVEAGAAAVGQRHPAVEVEAPAVGGEVGDVVGFPGQSARQVGQLYRLLATCGFEQHRQRRPVAQVGRHGIEGQAPRHAGFDAVGEAQDRTLPCREHRRGFALFSIAGWMRADHRDLAADVLFQQLLRRQQVEIKVLLDEGQRRPGGRAQQRGFRAHLRRHFAQRQARQAARQLDPAAFLDQCQVVVIDGHGHRLAVGGGGADILCRIGGVGQGGGQQAGGEQGFHGRLLCAAGNDSTRTSAVSWRHRHPREYPS
jgi:hypothetical protein